MTSRYPDGLGPSHHNAPRMLRRHASPLSLLLLSSLLAVGMAGFLGGHPDRHLIVDGDDVRLEWVMPSVLRNGEFFETTVLMTPKRPIGDLTLSVDATLWRGMTQNSMVPVAADETHQDGAFRFSYGAAELGSPFEVKMDFQVNPDLVGETEGLVMILDGKTRLVELPVTIKVRP